MPRTLGQRSVAVLLSALGLLLVYRAATQSVVYDEAFTYLAFLSGSPSLIFTSYTANNHVLFSTLSRASLGLFGTSALTLRLPTVIAGFAYLTVVAAVCRRGLGTGRLFALALAALTLNPFVLDFLVAARGYGLALACFMLAFHQFMLVQDASERPDARRWLAASLALALSVCANLTFFFPASALAITAIALDTRHGRRGSFEGLRYLRGIVPALAAAALLVVGILVLPLRFAKASHFAYGTDTLEQTALSLVTASLRYGRDAWPADPDFIQPDGPGLLILWGLIVPVLVGAGALVAGSLRQPASTEPAEAVNRLPALAGGAMLFTLLEVAAAHWLFGARYPYGRTGLYFVVLFLLTMAGIVWKVAQSPTMQARVGSITGLTLMALLIGRFAMELSTGHFYHWRYDAGTEDIFHTIIERSRNQPPGPIRVAGAEVFAPSLEFYRVTESAGNIIVDTEHWLESPADFDFFVVSPDTSRQLERTLPGLARIVYVHPISGAVLMENQGRVRR